MVEGTPLRGAYPLIYSGEVAERSKAHAWKACVPQKGTAGSNPALSAFMEGYVYILKSRRYNWHYIGSTRDLKKRFDEHERGKVKSSKFYRPFDLIYYEAYPDYSLARKREISLKKNQKEKEDLFKRLEV